MEIKKVCIEETKNAETFGPLHHLCLYPSGGVDIASFSPYGTEQWEWREEGVVAYRLQLLHSLVRGILVTQITHTLLLL